MTRLPTPGGDDGAWGDLLNDFLAVEHNADGSLKRVVRPGDNVTESQLPSSVILKSTTSGDTGKAIDAYTGGPLSFPAGNSGTPTASKELAYDPGTVNVARWRRRRYIDVTDVADFSAASHDTILNTILSNPAYAGQDIYLPDSVDYQITNRLLWQSSVMGTVGPRIVGDNNTVIKTTSASMLNQMLIVQGRVLTSNVALSADAASGSTAITVSSAAGITRGTLLRLHSNALHPHTEKSATTGEMIEVAAVSGSTIQLMFPTAYNYLVSDTARVDIIEAVQGGGIEITLENPFQPAWNSVVHGDGAQWGLVRDYCRNFKDEVRTSKMNSRGYIVRNCFDADAWVEGRDLMDKDSSFDSYGYVAEVAGVTRFMRFKKIIAERSRHGFTTTGGPLIGPGIPRDITIDHLWASQMTGAACDTHPEGDTVHFGRVVVKNTYSTGAQMRAANVTIDSLLIDGTGGDFPLTGAANGGLNRGGYGLWVQDGLESLKIGRVDIRNTQDGYYNPLSGSPATVNGSAIRIDGDSAYAGRVEIDEVTVENIDGHGISLGAQLIANGPYMPHKIGSYVGRNIGRTQASGSKNHINQSGSEVRPWASQTVIGTVDAEGGDRIVNASTESMVRVGKLLASRGVTYSVLQSTMTFGQIFKDSPSDKMYSPLATGPRLYQGDVGTLTSRQGIGGKAYAEGPGTFTKFRMELGAGWSGVTDAYVTIIRASDGVILGQSANLSASIVDSAYLDDISFSTYASGSAIAVEQGDELWLFFSAIASGMGTVKGWTLNATLGNEAPKLSSRRDTWYTTTNAPTSPVSGLSTGSKIPYIELVY